ncbi:Phosphoethanolamine N-methyltransferase 3-like protein 1 [Colletotrichum chlorophyti]|uniref:Phosphoethanolamine N-methyltransferase 3-like protein 1 n=1 Tax=Colletotrichum chlorophyti TaxID=708187 RepID=A0A1Q8RYW8_9PEZI|nr:Phosphoethanolamine N-methyltransferase 3-like protein 1 [Colletotrichum chlorophyti]
MSSLPGQETSAPVRPAVAPPTAESDPLHASDTALAEQNPAQVIEAAPHEGEEHGDTDSALGEDGANSTVSITSSILEYRTIRGRTFHSDRHDTTYFTPNDDQQSESVDITHHYLQLLLAGRLYLAPIKEDAEKVLDVGTGTGIWAMDFGDEHPNTTVIGTDLSPIQPGWVPPNVHFEIDDCTQPWTWDPNTFDFVHVRYLFGAIIDWTALFKEAYRACKPGGWVQSGEAEVEFRSDDDTIATDSAMATVWWKMYLEGGAKLGRAFDVVSKGLQRKALEEAGFVDIVEKNYKLPVGGWPADPMLAEVGRYVQLTMENDIEGYTLLMWNNILNWPKDEYQIFLMNLRKELRSKSIHSYMMVKFVYGRKPENAAV